MTGTGGIGAELADLCAAGGLELPTFSPGLQAQLRSCLPIYAAVQNPVDLTPIWRDYPTVYPQVLQAIGQSREIDLLVVCITDVPTQYPDLADAVAGWASRAPAQSTVVFWGARDQDCGGMHVLERAGLPCFRSTRETAAAAIALAKPS